MAATAGFPVVAPGRPGLVALGQGLSCGLLDGAGSHRVSLSSQRLSTWMPRGKAVGPPHSRWHSYWEGEDATSWSPQEGEMVQERPTVGAGTPQHPCCPSAQSPLERCSPHPQASRPLRPQLHSQALGSSVQRLAFPALVSPSVKWGQYRPSKPCSGVKGVTPGCGQHSATRVS